jgi:hypothetical protein
MAASETAGRLTPDIRHHHKSGSVRNRVKQCCSRLVAGKGEAHEKCLHLYKRFRRVRLGAATLIGLRIDSQGPVGCNILQGSLIASKCRRRPAAAIPCDIGDHVGVAFSVIGRHGSRIVVLLVFGFAYKFLFFRAVSRARFNWTRAHLESSRGGGTVRFVARFGLARMARTRVVTPRRPSPKVAHAAAPRRLSRLSGRVPR